MRTVVILLENCMIMIKKKCFKGNRFLIIIMSRNDALLHSCIVKFNCLFYFIILKLKACY